MVKTRSTVSPDDLPERFPAVRVISVMGWLRFQLGSDALSAGGER
ncbi:protein of unknown function [Micropruina glycogenica]|uniref:Uncharacterized protein n=1 Tax=Micropruina glycogenica TaxID=75385 RepID=A0A2N9JGK6_9ACTN|nr:protein of unknown function [Micropruina glycogenica]